MLKMPHSGVVFYDIHTYIRVFYSACKFGRVTKHLHGYDIGWDFVWTTSVWNLKSLLRLVMKVWKAMQSVENGVAWGYSRSLEIAPFIC